MSKLLTKKLFTKATGKYSGLVTFTYDEAKEAYLAVDQALKVARSRKQDKYLPASRHMAEGRKAQILSKVKNGLQEALEQLRKAEQARIEGRWRKQQETQKGSKVDE